jgi:hypothetical protein
MTRFASLLLLTSTTAFATSYKAFNVTCELKANDRVIDSFTDSSYGIYENGTSQFVHTLVDNNGSIYKMADINIRGFEHTGYAPKFGLEFDVEDKVKELTISDNRFKMTIDRDSRPNFHLYAWVQPKYNTHFETVNFDIKISFKRRAFPVSVQRTIDCRFEEYKQ